MATLILTCSTGQGHNSCARAIQEYYQAQGETCTVEDALAFVSPRISKIICWGHVTIYRHFHGLFQIGYRYSEKHSGVFAEDSGIHRLLTMGTERIRDFLVSRSYDTVICTHTFASIMMTEVQRRYHLPIRTCLVATDYTCNPGTKESEVDLHFIPAEPLSVYYECPRIADDQIVSSGIPIRQMFYHSVSKTEAKLAFGIPTHHQHLLMMCGSMGCGPMKNLTRQLARQMNGNTDLTIVCGTNRSLFDELSRKYRGQDNIHILGYVEDMSKLLDSADLYLTKPGGISVSEAAMKNLPMVFVDAVAGCEEYNKIYFIQKQAAKTGRSVRELTEVCLDLLEHPEKLQKMRRNLLCDEKHNAAAVIFERMTGLEPAEQKERCCG